MGASDHERMSLGRAASFFRAPGGVDNKYTRPVVQVVTGSDTYPGAGLLSVLGAVHAGAGLVRFDGMRRVSATVVDHVPEVVLGSGWSHSVVVGCGFDRKMSAHAEAAVRRASEAKLPVVVDAGGLLEFGGWPHSGAHLVLTPHAGEAARLYLSMTEHGEGRAEDVVFEGSRRKKNQKGASDREAKRKVIAERISRDPIAMAMEIAQTSSSTVVLKGSTTVVAGAEGEVWTVEAPSGWAATAGSGDVLAGVLGTVLAANRDDEDKVAVVAAGVMAHAYAAGIASRVVDLAGHRTGSLGQPITATQIARALPAAVGALLDLG